MRKVLCSFEICLRTFVGLQGFKGWGKEVGKSRKGLKMCISQCSRLDKRNTLTFTVTFTSTFNFTSTFTVPSPSPQPIDSMGLQSSLVKSILKNTEKLDIYIYCSSQFLELSQTKILSLANPEKPWTNSLEASHTSICSL